MHALCLTKIREGFLTVICDHLKRDNRPVLEDAGRLMENLSCADVSFPIVNF